MMFYGPFALVLTWLVGLASVAILGGGVYLLYGWYVGAVVGTGYLVAGSVMTAGSVLGRWIVLLFHPRGANEPRPLEPASRLRLERPDGTSLYVERYGHTDAPAIILTHGAAPIARPGTTLSAR